MSYQELKIHGKSDFPFELYRLEKGFPKYEMVHHYHPFIEIILIDKGVLSVTLNTRKYLAKKGDVIIVNSGVIHGAKPEDCTYRCLVFSLAFIKTGNFTGDRLIDEFLSQDKFFYEKITDEKFYDQTLKLFNSMEDHFDQPFNVMGNVNLWFSHVLENKFYTAGHQREESKNHNSLQKLKKALNFIRSNYSKNITIDDIASSTTLSSKYFCAFFKTMTNKTAIEYLVDYRIEQAAKKLISSDDSITTISFDCGFNDLSYFIKTFKIRKGVSPNEYRKNNGIKK